MKEVLFTVKQTKDDVTFIVHEGGEYKYPFKYMEGESISEKKLNAFLKFQRDIL